MKKDNVFLYVVMAAFAIAPSAWAIDIENEANATTQTNATSTVNVDAGGGNASMSLNAFSPQTVEISAGESVTWTNPTQVPEPPYRDLYPVK